MLYTDEDEGQLFERHADPREQPSLYYRAQYRDVRNALLLDLLKWRCDLADTAYCRARRGLPMAAFLPCEPPTPRRSGRSAGRSSDCQALPTSPSDCSLALRPH